MTERIRAALPLMFMLVLALALPAYGQTANRSNFRVVELKAGQGPSQALVGAGCKIGWLAQVMADSNINPAQTRRLPRGKELFIEGDCAKEPPPLVAQLTSFILRTDRTLAESRGLARQIAGLRRERDTARGELAELRKGFSAAENKAKTLAAELEKAANARKSLDAEVAGLRKQLAAVPPTGSLWPSLLGGFLLGLLIGAGAGAFLWRRRSRDKLVLTRSVRVSHPNGETYAFELHSFEPDAANPTERAAYYKCPLCAERKVMEHNCRRHLMEAHPELRVTEREVALTT